MANPMLQRFFSHNLIRKYVIAFGSMFDHIVVVAFDQNGVEANRKIVPIRYGPREKWAVRNEQDPTLTRSFAMTYPRMAFEIVGYRYNAAKQQPSLTYARTAPTGNYSTQTTNNFSYAPVPYVLEFQLYITSKSVDEAAQIVEQILPFFTPDFNITVNSVTEQNTELQCPLTLTGINCSDTYTGDLRDRRTIEWSLTFEMQVQFYGPLRSQGITKTSTINVDDVPNSVNTDGATLRTAPTHVELNSNLNLRLKRAAVDDYGFSEFE